MNAQSHSKPLKIQICSYCFGGFKILADSLQINDSYNKQEKQSLSSKNVKISIIIYLYISVYDYESCVKTDLMSI